MGSSLENFQDTEVSGKAGKSFSGSVVDPDPFNMDPAFQFDTDPDPTV